MIDRRNRLKTGAAASPMAALPQWAQATPSSDLAALFDAFGREALEISPESATFLNMDKGAHAGLRGKLSDGSSVGRAAARAGTFAA